MIVRAVIWRCPGPFSHYFSIRSGAMLLRIAYYMLYGRLDRIKLLVRLPAVNDYWSAANLNIYLARIAAAFPVTPSYLRSLCYRAMFAICASCTAEFQ